MADLLPVLRTIVLRTKRCSAFYQHSSSQILPVCARNFHSSITVHSNQIVGEDSATKDNLVNLVGRDFLSLRHFKKEELYQFLWTAKDLKFRMKENKESLDLLRGVNAIGIFHPKSAESRLSFELGMTKLGGHMIFLRPEDIEELTHTNMKDAANLVSGLSDVIVTAGFSQEEVDQLANDSPSPLISAFSTLQHPLQTISQLLTLLEYFGYLRGLSLAWVGNGSNVLNSLLYGCARLGIDFKAATPPGYETDADVMINAMNHAGKTGASFHLGNDPIQAVYRADAVLSGPWGQQGSAAPNLSKDFNGFQITRKMLKESGGDWVFMHSLPRLAQEVTDDVFYGQESLVHKEVENRLWAAMAVLVHLNQPYVPTTPMPKFVRG